MKIARLVIKNFRGVKSAELGFDGHTLLSGTNNVGKSTVCEALDLVLGPNRLSKMPQVEEFEFYNAKYLDASNTPIPIEIEVVLTELSNEVANKCAPALEYWDFEGRRVLGRGDVRDVDKPHVCECLRLKTIAQYEPEEDEFRAKTVFMGAPAKPDGSQLEAGRQTKQLFGFLYLRALRTGARALSLERGSLLDIILQQKKVNTGLWQSAIGRLRNLHPPIDGGTSDLTPVLTNIEERISQYIHLQKGERATKLFVSQLTREHLRKTISFFLKTADDQEPVPFQDVGTGTLNMLVLALLSFIADLKTDVIFAMEEPEIALPPHTQRRVTKYLLENTAQCFVTSHSPYVIERFKPEQIRILQRSADGVLVAKTPPPPAVLKGKTYRRFSRRGLSEAMLGRGVIVAEGLTERESLLAAAEKMEETDPSAFYPLDLSGVTVFTSEGEGSIPEFGHFFHELGLKTFCFYDSSKRKAEEESKRQKSFDFACQTKYRGAERMLVEEVPQDRLRELLKELRDSGEESWLASEVIEGGIDLKDLAFRVLKDEKGSGYAARLIGKCTCDELPATIVAFLKRVYDEFPAPAPVSSVHDKSAAQADNSAAKAASQPAE